MRRIGYGGLWLLIPAAIWAAIASATPRAIPGIRAGANGATGAAFTWTYGTLTATGTTQGTCTPITNNVTNITAGDAKGACLPASGGLSVGDIYEVICSVSASPGGWSGSAFQHYCLIFPGSGDTVTPFSANASDTLPAGMMARYRFKGSSTWSAEHGANETSDGNSSFGLAYVYGDLSMGGGGSAIARIQMSGNSGNQINLVGVGENKVSFPDNTASAFYLWTSSDGNKYLEFTSTNSGERITVEQPLYVGPNSGGGANQLGILEMVGIAGNQINFDTNSGENYIGVPNNTASALEFQVRANGTNMMVLNTTNRMRVVFNVPIAFGSTGAVTATGSTQANATQIPAGVAAVRLVSCDGTKGVALPTGAFAMAVSLMATSSTSTNTCKVYGANAEDDTINSGAADASYTQIAGSSLLYQTDDGVNWFTY